MPSKKFTEKAVRSAALPLTHHEPATVQIGGFTFTRVGRYTGVSLGNAQVRVIREGGNGEAFYIEGRFNAILPRVLHALNFAK